MEFVENSIFLFMKRTTITDLAKACGTSKSTVSRVLTKKGYVSPEKESGTCRKHELYQ